MVERKYQKPKTPIHPKLFFHANTKFSLSKQSLEFSKKFKTTPKMKRSFVGLISFEKDVLYVVQTSNLIEVKNKSTSIKLHAKKSCLQKHLQMSRLFDNACKRDMHLILA